MKQKKAMLDVSKKLAIVFTAAGLLSPGTVISAGQGYKAVTVGDNHSCALHESGKIECWGIRNSRITIAPEGTFTQLDAGRRHTCAIDTEGAVHCWGNRGIWKRGEYNSRHASPEARFTQVSSGANYVCGVKEDGYIACWGGSHSAVHNTPTKHPAAKPFFAVSSGSDMACGLHLNGTALCWSGRIRLDGRFKQLSVGVQKTCGIRPDDTLACWKHGSPAKAPKGTFRHVSVNQFNCGVHTDGSVECWSYADPCCNNTYGQLTPPKGAFTQVDVGTHHACGIKEDKTVACWGNY